MRMDDDSQPPGRADGHNGGVNGRAGRGKPRASAGAANLEKLFDRVPPHSLDAEQSLLGSLILDPSMFGEVVTLVHEGGQFYSQAHAAIFDAMRELYDGTSSVDMVQLGELLRDRDVLELTGGEDYLLGLAESVPSAAGAVRYARIVSNKARLRKLIDAAGDILYESYHAQSVTDDETDRVIDGAQQRIFEIAGERETSGPEKVHQLIQAEFDRLERIADGEIAGGLRTGYLDLDEITTGLQPGEMLIIAARPSMGKTALALNLAEQVAFGGRTPWTPRSKQTHHCPVGFFSLEMSRGALAQRLLSSRSGVSSEKLRSGDVSASEWERLTEAAAALHEAPIYVDDSPGLSVLQLRAKARRMHEKHTLKAIFIDYLQLLTAPGAARESRQVEVSAISRQIKSLARELSVPVVCLAQLNRGAEQRERNRPRMSDLRESGSIEQDADVVMLLHREAYYHRGDPEWDPKSPEFNPENEEKLNLAELIVAKQRNGPTGTVQMVWDEAVTRFKDRDPHASPPGYSGPGYSGPGSMPPMPDASPPAAGGPGGSGGASFGPSGSAGEAWGGGPADVGGAFAPGRRTGPVDDHRDGGGPDMSGLPGLDDDDDDGDDVPF